MLTPEDAAEFRRYDDSLRESLSRVEQPTLESLHPAAARCFKRIEVVLPPSDPHALDDPSVALSTLVAILHATLASLRVTEEALRANAEEAEAILRGDVLVSMCAIRIRNRSLAALGSAGVGDKG